MDINTLTSWLTEGLTPEQAEIVKAQINKDGNKARLVALKAQDEYGQLETRVNALQSELDGVDGKPGTKAYKDWYDKNYSAVAKLSEDIKKYDAKYGDGAYNKMMENGAAPNNPPNTAGLTEDQVARLVDQRIQSGYAPRWSDLLVNTGDLVQRHMFAGRKTPIDFKVVAELAEKKYNGNLNQAYDEWDKPEREKVETAARETEIKRRVDEELQKRGASAQFPTGADMTPSALSQRTKTEVDKFDKTALTRDLAKEWVGAGVQ